MVRRAQSSGEWLGVRRTFLRGLVGIELWVGGGAREGAVSEEVGVRFGRGERLGMGPREGAMREGVVGRAFSRGIARVPPDARCAEFAAGKEGMSGSGDEGFEPSREKIGMLVLGEGWEAFARGVVGEEGILFGGAGFLNRGGGGGGMAARSSAALLGGGIVLFPIIGASWSDSVIFKLGASVDFFTFVFPPLPPPSFFISSSPPMFPDPTSSLFPASLIPVTGCSLPRKPHHVAGECL